MIILQWNTRTISGGGGSIDNGQLALPLLVGTLVEGDQLDGEGLLGPDLAHHVDQLIAVLVLVAHHPVHGAVARHRIVLHADAIAFVRLQEGGKDLLVQMRQVGVPVEFQVDGSFRLQEDALLEACVVQLVVAQVNVQRCIGRPLKVECIGGQIVDSLMGQVKIFQFVQVVECKVANCSDVAILGAVLVEVHFLQLEVGISLLAKSNSWNGSQPVAIQPNPACIGQRVECIEQFTGVHLLAQHILAHHVELVHVGSDGAECIARYPAQAECVHNADGLEANIIEQIVFQLNNLRIVQHELGETFILRMGDRSAELVEDVLQTVVELSVARYPAVGAFAWLDQVVHGTIGLDQHRDRGEQPACHHNQWELNHDSVLKQASTQNNKQNTLVCLFNPEWLLVDCLLGA